MIWLVVGMFAMGVWAGNSLTLHAVHSRPEAVCNAP